MMRFKAEYIPRVLSDNKTKDEQSYWRTIDADSLNEAIRLAEKMTRKNYRLLKILGE